MTAVLRFGKVMAVVAVIFFLSVSLAFGGVLGRASGVPGIEVPVDAILVPVKALKDFTLALLHVVRAGKSILLGASFETDSRGEAVSFL